MNKRFFVTFLVGSAMLAASCNSGGIRRNPGKIYAPDMTYSRAYDAYTENPVTANGLTSQEPVPGTIARGHALPLHLTAADTSAYYALQSPYKFTEAEMTEGTRLYNIYCGICHGDKLDGNGPLYKDGAGPFAAAPANLKGGAAYLNMTIGKMYYAVVYGKNVMGSYASQLNVKQRWQVLAYIKKVQSKNGGAPFTLDAEAGATTATANTAKDTAAAKPAMKTDSAVAKK
ncbi:quinol:cytochrome C oxidoreductase [Taibaiella sp. KBW10]|uniref:c-type cytochrome n=1 Tax=Taibaiella sp. KBW10 TaxID=2153357 RepID=UPI000F5B0EAC|nr:cytochrome c [Taibaiella sp. KBW10]RQO30586.1 quinol:cytochrome C oxidoreductase [Taibaiella sp. KBW10]